MFLVWGAIMAMIMGSAAADVAVVRRRDAGLAPAPARWRSTTKPSGCWSAAPPSACSAWPSPRRASSSPAAPSRRITGLPCPTCGVTRTIIALSRGDVDRALFLNPLAAIACGVGLLYLLYAAAVLALRLPRFRPTVSAAGARRVRIARRRRPRDQLDLADRHRPLTARCARRARARGRGRPARRYDRRMSTAVPTTPRMAASWRSELRPLGRLAWPVILAEIGWMAMGIVDTLMVGPLGPEAIGGVGLAGILFFAMAACGMGLLLGLDTVVSQAYGAGDHDACRRWLWQGLWLGLFAALPLAGLLWLQRACARSLRRQPGHRRRSSTATSTCCG